jgi:hypothetical protein
MSTIFDLAQSAQELPSQNFGMNNIKYVTRPPTRDISGDNFSKGFIHYKWSVAGNQWWIPSRSYLRLRFAINSVKVAAGAAVQPVKGSDVAPAMGICGCLFQNMSFKIGDKTVSRLESNVAQVDALEKRTGKSAAWLNNAGGSLEFWEPRQDIRAAEINEDGEYFESKTNMAKLGLQNYDYIAEFGTQLNRVAQGFDAQGAGNTIEFTAEGSVVTFDAGGGAALPADNPYFVGDKLLHLGILYTVTKVLTPATMQVSPVVLADIAAADVDWFQYVNLPKPLTRVQQGFDAVGAAANSIEVTQAPDQLEFLIGGDAVDLPNLANLYKKNDKVVYLGVEYVVDTVVSSTAAAGIVTVFSAPAAVAASSTEDWFLKKNEATAAKNSSFRHNELEACWQLPLSIMKIGQALPQMECELILNPQISTSYQQLAVESVQNSLNTLQTPTVVNNFSLTVTRAEFYVCTVEGPRVPENISYFLSLEQTHAQVQDIAAGTSEQLRSFEVSPSTYAITAAFQDRASNTPNTLFSPSKFKIRPINVIDGAGGVTAVLEDGALGIERFNISYANQLKPSPDYNPDWEGTGARGFLKKQYMDAIAYSGTYFASGSAESFEDWIDRGIYFYFVWTRDGDSTNTRADVSYQFNKDLGSNGRVILFDHYRKILIINVRNGKIDRIIEQNA